MSSVEFNEYPKVMKHPAHRAAVIAKWDPKIKDQALQPRGQPVRFPDVTVHNKDQELQHASMGYRPAGVSDEKAYMRAVIGADAPPTYVQTEYPKWLYKVVDEDLESKLVDNAAQEKALGAGWHRTPDDAHAAIDEPIENEVEEEAAAPVRKVKRAKAKPKTGRRRSNPLTTAPAPISEID